MVTQCCTPPSWPCRPSVAASSTSTPTAPASMASSPTLVKATAPSLLDLPGVGIHTAALLLVAAGDNAERITSEAAFAHLCGVAPIHASSGKTDPPPAQPRRQPASQPRPVAHRVHPHELGPTHPRLRRTTPRSKDAPNPRSCASSSATSPARCTATSPACSATIGAAGLALEMPSTPHGCPTNDLPTRHSTHPPRHRLA